MLKKGDIVEYVDESPDAWSGRKGSIGIVNYDEHRSSEGSGNMLVGVKPISSPSNDWPRLFFASVWRKIAHSE